jgi:hypothetical protein
MRVAERAEDGKRRDVSGAAPGAQKGLATAFEARWRFARTITDARAGAVSRVAGYAVLSRALPEVAPEPQGGLIAEERGRMRLADGARLETRQQRLWRFPEPGVLVFCYPEGGEIARFALDENGVAEATHLCGADFYQGRLRLALDRDLWTLSWRVDGPRKAYLSETRFVRA